MAYKVTQRISSCRAPPGVRRTICPENLYCDRKMADFSAVVIDTSREAWLPAIGERTVTVRLPMASAATIQL